MHKRGVVKKMLHVLSCHEEASFLIECDKVFLPSKDLLSSLSLTS